MNISHLHPGPACNPATCPNDEYCVNLGTLGFCVPTIVAGNVFYKCQHLGNGPLDNAPIIARKLPHDE